MTKQVKIGRIAVIAAIFLLMMGFLIGFLVRGNEKRPYVYSDNTRTLLYHLVAEETYGDYPYLFVRPADFEKQLQEIQRRNLPTYFADEVAKADGKPCVVLTFDDGYGDNYDTVFPLLQKYNMKATIFLITDAIGKEGHLTKEEILEMQKSGLVRFGSHTVTHPKLDTIPPAEMRYELKKSKEVLENLLGKPVNAVAYPNGAYQEEIKKAAAEAGYTYAYSTDPAKEMYYENTALPRDYVVRDMAWEDFLAILDH